MQGQRRKAEEVRNALRARLELCRDETAKINCMIMEEKAEFDAFRARVDMTLTDEVYKSGVLVVILIVC